MLQMKQIEFRYKGERDYIQGPDMFQAIMGIGKSAEEISNILFSIHEFVYTPICKLYITDNKESLSEVMNIAARCQCDIDGITQWAAIAPDDKKQRVAERYAYDEGQVVSKCAMRGDGITLNQLSPYSFIETVVTMNKYMHQKLFPEVVGRWVFTRIDLPVFCNARKDLAIKFRHNMHYRLTKCDIELAGIKVGDIFFSLVKS